MRLSFTLYAIVEHLEASFLLILKFFEIFFSLTFSPSIAALSLVRKSLPNHSSPTQHTPHTTAMRSGTGSNLLFLILCFHLFDIVPIGTWKSR